LTTYLITKRPDPNKDLLFGLDDEKAPFVENFVVAGVVERFNKLIIRILGGHLK